MNTLRRAVEDQFQVKQYDRDRSIGDICGPGYWIPMRGQYLPVFRRKSALSGKEAWGKGGRKRGRLWWGHMRELQQGMLHI